MSLFGLFAAFCMIPRSCPFDDSVVCSVIVVVVPNIDQVLLQTEKYIPSPK